MRRCVVVAILLLAAPAAAAPRWSIVAPASWTRTWVGSADENARMWTAPGGNVRLTAGVVRPLDAALTAPLSGRPCLVHRSRARLFARDGELVDEAIDSAAAPFALETPSGRVIVDEAPQLDVTPAMIAPRHKDRERAFLSAHGRATADQGAVAFDEIVVAPGDTVVVHGMLKIAIDGASTVERGYRDAPPTVVRLVPPPSGALAIRQLWT